MWALASYCIRICTYYHAIQLTQPLLFSVVAEDNRGTQFNGSNVSMTQGITKVHFSGLDWEYGRPQNGPEYLMANGLSNEDVTVAVSKNYSLST